VAHAEHTNAVPTESATPANRCEQRHPSAIDTDNAASQPARPATVPSRRLAKALWVWKVDEVMRDASETARLVALCRAQRVDTVFLHIPYQIREDGQSWRVQWPSRQMATLVQALRSAKVEAEALLGTPQLALVSHHAAALAVVRAVIAYNADHVDAPQRRFSGVHLDIEPYLLPSRSPWYGQYLQLLQKVRRLTVAAGLRLNVDIPFWFDDVCLPPGPQTSGEWRRLSELVIDLADRVTLMDYRTTVDGSNGLIALASDELRYAAVRQRQVMIGLEVAQVSDETRGRFDVAGDGDALFIEQLDAERARITWPLSQCRVVTTTARHEVLRQVSQRRVAADRISFAHRGPAALSRVLRQTVVPLRRYASFVGFAIHDYQGLAAWSQKRTP